MAEGWGPAAANAALDATATAYPWVKLHVGAPGAAGTANPATETIRRQVTAWNAAAASGGTSTKTSNADVTWTAIAGSQDATHISGWTLATAGVFGWSGGLVANPYVAGDVVTIPAGQLSMSLPNAS